MPDGAGLERQAPRLVAAREALAYHDVQSVRLARDMTALEAWNAAMLEPMPLIGLAFRIRDAVSARFGVKRIGGFTGRQKTQVAEGDMLDFFRVEGVTDRELVLTERDRHLDVMTTITTDPLAGGGCEMTITSSVVTHNLFGRLYMIPVGLAHPVIVKRMMRVLSRKGVGA